MQYPTRASRITSLPGQAHDQAIKIVTQAFAIVLGLDEKDIAPNTDFFENGGGSIQIIALQEYLNSDQGQDPKLRHKLEQHVLFTNPRVQDIAGLLLERAESLADFKSEEELTDEATLVVKEAFAKVLGLVLEDVDDGTNLFENGGGSMQVVAIQEFLKSANGQNELLQQRIEQHELFAQPTVGGIAKLLLQKAMDAQSKSGDSIAAIKSIELVASELCIDPNEYYPASFQQEQTFVLNASGAGAAYNMPWIVDLRGNFNKEAMVKAQDFVVRREQPLRTILKLDEISGMVVQRVLPAEISQSLWELCEHNANSLKEAYVILEKEQDYNFDITKAPVSRMHIVNITDTHHLVMCNSHHVHHDTGSVVTYRRHVLDTYIAICKDEGIILDDSAKKFDYVAFATWQREVLTAKTVENELAYWKKELDGARALSFPKDPTATLGDGSGAMVTLRIDPDVAAKFKQSLSNLGCTPFMGGMALLHIMLSRWFNEDDIVTGAAIANRDAHPSYSDRLGCFRNVLPIRSNSADNPTFADMLQEIKRKIIQSWSAKEIPYHQVIASMADKNFRGFNCMYAFQDAEWHHISTDTSELGFQAKVAYLNKDRTKFDVHLMLRWNIDGAIDGDLIFAASKFGQGTMQRFADEYAYMATAIAENDLSATTIMELPMVPPKEEEMIVEKWNQTSPCPSFQAFTSVGDSVVEAIRHHPSAIAVEEAGTGSSYTYCQLLETIVMVAGGIGIILGVHKTNRQPRIALVFNQGFPMYASLVAALRCGGVIIPIDAHHTPVARAAFMLRDSKADIVIHDKLHSDFAAAIQTLGENDIPPFHVYNDVVAKGSECKEFSSNSHSTNEDSLAYILFTSGTSGTPKPVCITHSNMHNMMCWWTSLVNLNEQDKVLHFSSFSFVMSLRQIFPTFLVSATLVSPKNGVEFEDAIVKFDVTKMALTPSALGILDPERCKSLKVVQVAGEACPSNLANLWAGRLEFFYIGLGPTELCGHACCGQFRVGDGVNIGMPVSNSAVYILNKSGKICPVGVIGELCVAGKNVAKGYLNQEELTKKHFVVNPFDRSKPTMYKVGDLARRLEDGRIEFFGRADMQVKIRGFRIELKEISSVLMQAGPVQQAHVIPIKSGEKGEISSLLAYVTPSLDGEKLNEIKDMLKSSLPPYMVPEHIFSLDHMPLNKNGKLDRAALPTLKDKGDDHATDRPTLLDDKNPIVSFALFVFATELGLKTGGMMNRCKKSFFELGGTSLSAVRSVRQIGEGLNISLKVTDLIQQPTLQDFILHLLKEVDDSKQFRASTKNDLNISSDGQQTRITGVEISWATFSVLHAFAMLALVVFSIVLPVGVGVCIFFLVLDNVGFPHILPMLPLIYCSIVCANLIVTSIAMIFLSPRQRYPCQHPLMSLNFLSWWLMRRMVSVTNQMLWFANGSKVMVFVYRMLGAQIGRNVTIDNVILDIPSLVKVMDGCSIGLCTRLVCGEIRDDTLFIAPVLLQKFVKTEPRSSVTPGATVGQSCVVRAWASVTSSLPKTETPYEIFGSPASYGSAVVEEQSICHVPIVTHRYIYLLIQMISMYLVSLISFVGVGLSCVIGVNVVGANEGSFARLLYFVIASAPAALVVLLAAIVVTKRSVLNRPTQNIVHSGALFYIRVWFIDTLLLSPMLSLALEYLLPPSLYHLFFIAMGGTAGKHTFWNSPQIRAGVEHISIGETLHSGFLQIWDTQTITPDGITFKPISIGDDCTIGQRTVVMPGITLGNHATVGSEGALMEDLSVPNNGTVIGNPPRVFVSSRDDAFAVQQMQESLQANLMERGESVCLSNVSPDSHSGDGSAIIFNIIAVCVNIIKLPFVVAVFVGWYHLLDPLLLSAMEPTYYYLSKCVIAVATYLMGAISIATLVALMTRSGIASFRQGYTGYYTPRFIVWWIFLWLNRFCSGLLLYPFQGTILYSLWLKCVGARIGKRSFIDPGPSGLFEIDNISVGNSCVLLTPNIHGHFVDHGALQFATVVIGDHVRVNDGATVMPFTSIGNNITLLTQCTTIKAMDITEPGLYSGNVASQLRTRDSALMDSIDSARNKLKSVPIATESNQSDQGLRLVVIGQQAFGAAVLQQLLERGENVVAVCGNPTKEGQSDDPVIMFAKERGIEVYQPMSWKTQAAIDKMKSFKADFCLMAYVTKFVPADVAECPRFGTVCFHPSLLPEHRGPSAISWAIASGKSQTGISVFWPNDGLDEGPIFIQKSCSIDKDETLGDLYSKKLFPMGVDAMVEAVDLVSKGQIRKIEQNLSEGSYESWFRNAAVELDFRNDANDVYNVIRAANPSPGAVASFSGSRVKIFDSRMLKNEAEKEVSPGTVISINEEGVLVQSKGGCILLKRVESEDGQRMLASKWTAKAGVSVGSMFDFPKND